MIETPTEAVAPADHETELSPETIVRAWEDRRFRGRLSQHLLNQLPAHPAGGRRLILVRDPDNAARAYSNFGSCDACSTNNCSSSNCSSDNCSTSNCSSDNCSSSNCSSSNCTGHNC